MYKRLAFRLKRDSPKQLTNNTARKEAYALTFKEKFIAFIMKKWTAPIVCGVCIVLILGMSANSFAKYYTRIQEERSASVAVYATNVGSNQYTYKGHVKILFQENYTTNQKTYPLPYYQKYETLTDGTKIGNDADGKNYDCSFYVTNKANGRVCEVRLQYTIKITFPKALPNGVTWTLIGSNEAGTYNNSTTRTFTSSSYVFEAGVEKNTQHIIRFRCNNPGWDMMAYPLDEYYEDVIIQITATQVTD